MVKNPRARTVRLAFGRFLFIMKTSWIIKETFVQDFSFPRVCLDREHLMSQDLFYIMNTDILAEIITDCTKKHLKKYFKIQKTLHPLQTHGEKVRRDFSEKQTNCPHSHFSSLWSKTSFVSGEERDDEKLLTFTLLGCSRWFSAWVCRRLYNNSFSRCFLLFVPSVFGLLLVIIWHIFPWISCEILI